MAEFKDRLNEALNIRNISPAELAHMTGVNEGAISQYRKGAYKASQRNLEKISNALHVSIPWLMGADVDMDIIEQPFMSLSLTAQKVAKAYDKATERDQQIVCTLLDVNRTESDNPVIPLAAKGGGVNRVQLTANKEEADEAFYQLSKVDPDA